MGPDASSQRAFLINDGNNSYLVKKTMKVRSHFKEVKEISEASVIWQPWKKSEVFLELNGALC